MRVVLLYNQVSDTADEAERDVLVQAEAVENALRELGHEPIRIECTLQLADLQKQCLAHRPDVVFNLVESLAGSDWLAHVVPSLLDVLQIPYTGNPAEALLISNHKVLAKRYLRLAGLPTPDWVLPQSRSPGEADLAGETFARNIFSFSPQPAGAEKVPPTRGSSSGGAKIPLVSAHASDLQTVYLMKAVREHASVGLDDNALLMVRNAEELQRALDRVGRQWGRPVFAERFIEGREFNLSVLAGPEGPQVLPPAEIDFSAFPPGKARIVGYAAKWEEGSFEYHHTPRRFDFPPSDRPLLEQLEQLALACWRLFGLAGYARVDFRVDAAGKPWILEINTNPCLSPDAGFAAAVQQAGLTYAQAIQRILQDAFRSPTMERALQDAFTPQSIGRSFQDVLRPPAMQQNLQDDLRPSDTERIVSEVSPGRASEGKTPAAPMGVAGNPADRAAPFPQAKLPEGYRFREQPRPDDRDAVRDIVASTGFFNPAEIEVADELVRERLSAGAASGYYFVFLDHHGKAVGYACYGPIAATAESFDLYWIAVHRTYQGQGLGRIILQECENRIRQAGGRRIYIETSGRPQYEPTRRFYQRCGYRCEARLQDFYAPGDDKWIYVKVLE